MSKLSSETYTDLTILGQNWDIVHTPSWLMSTSLGECQQDTQKILIRSGLQGQQAADTLLHETIHAVDMILGLDMSEQQVRLLATGLIQVFQANPEFYGWIAERLEEEDERRAKTRA